MVNQASFAAARVWAQRLERFENAEMTVAQFCKSEGVSQASFYKWRHKLRDRNATVIDGEDRVVAKFVPVSFADDQSNDQRRHQGNRPVTMSIELPGGIQIRFEVPSTEVPSRQENGSDEVTAS